MKLTPKLDTQDIAVLKHAASLSDALTGLRQKYGRPHEQAPAHKPQIDIWQDLPGSQIRAAGKAKAAALLAEGDAAKATKALQAVNDELELAAVAFADLESQLRAHCYKAVPLLFSVARERRDAHLEAANDTAEAVEAHMKAGNFPAEIVAAAVSAARRTLEAQAPADHWDSRFNQPTAGHYAHTLGSVEQLLGFTCKQLLDEHAAEAKADASL